MPELIRGNHHLTFCVGPAQEDYDFHTRTLGLRSIKKTALYDGQAPVYHLYYGNGEGDPGTILTSFPFRQQGVVGKRGTNQISRLNLSVPAEALGFWSARLREAGIASEEVELHGTPRLHFSHPCGLPYALVADGDGDAGRSWEGGGVSAEDAILGTHGITVSVAYPEEMTSYLTKGVGADSVLECVGTQESMMQAIKSTRPGGYVGYVGVPHGVSLDGHQLFFSHVHLHGGPAPVRRYLSQLIDLVFKGKINPGKVFDLELPLDRVAEGYRAMDERRAIKTLLRP